MIEELSIPHTELPARVASIKAKGGEVTRMKADSTTYTITVRWTEPQAELIAVKPECGCDICRDAETNRNSGHRNAVASTPISHAGSEARNALKAMELEDGQSKEADAEKIERNLFETSG